ncbi:hypothetical protein [Salinigranum halophilum]|uniref:hypothetical protein n=1 Tax=Salinigranum halophilum TaxID=2565931 RepID=UPI0010A78FF5|nr:hypothetical protein [Salinigranum halophilum]
MSEEADVDENPYEEVAPARDIQIEKATRHMYRELQNDDSSPFEGAQQLKIFLNAAAVGSQQGLRQPLTGDRAALFNVSSLSDRHHTLINSIAWRETQEEEIYYNHKRAFEIAMECANGGIRHLYQSKLGMGDNTSETLSEYVSRWRDIEAQLEEKHILTSSE